MPKTAESIQTMVSTQLVNPLERPPIPPSRHHYERFRFYFVIYKLISLFAGNFWLSLLGHKTMPTREKRTVQCLRRLGMLWIRVFQTFAMRGAILSAAAGQRVMDLVDTGSASKFASIRNIIEKDLGCSMEKVFDRFEEKPFAATTVSQLHRARLCKEKVWTAVKVQQPLAAKIFSLDLKLFSYIIRIVTIFSIRRNMRWEELLHELNEIKTRELNYYYEAAALETFADNLKGRPVFVPRVFRKYCSRRVLVMEFIQGALLSDIIEMQRTDPRRLEKWLETNHIDLKKVARNLFHSTLRQVFEDNFFHGDMNTHTIILLKNSRIALIECRSAGSLEAESLKKQHIFLRALAEKEYVIAAEVYFLLASRLPRVNLSVVKEQLVRIWRVWETRVHVKDLPYHQKSLGYMTEQVIRVVYDSRFMPMWSFARLTCAWVHLDIAMGVLNPELNYLDYLKRYFHLAEQRKSLKKMIRMPQRLASAAKAFHNGPRRTDEYDLFKEVLLRKQAQVVQESASKLDAVMAAGFGTISFGILMAGIFVFFVFLIRRMGWEMSAIIGPQLTSVAAFIPEMAIGIWLLLLIFFALCYGFFKKLGNQFGAIGFGRADHGNGVDR